ncbi:hypothetical protein ACOSQ2_003915 [Xanthoceras sorbifolium]
MHAIPLQSRGTSRTPRLRTAQIGPRHDSHRSTTPPPSKVPAPPDFPTNRRSGKAVTAERDPLTGRPLYPLNQLHHRSINTLDVTGHPPQPRETIHPRSKHTSNSDRY